MAYEQTLPPIEQVAEPPGTGARTPWGYADMAKAVGVVVVGTILAALPVAVIAAIIARGSDIDEGDAELAVALGANLLLEVLLLVAVAMFSVRKYNVSWAMVGLRLPERGSWWLPLALLGGALMVISVYFAVLAAMGVEPNGNIPDEAFDSVPLIILVGILSIGLAPAMEETFFRGFLFGGLRGRWGVFFAALSTGFLFAVAHVDPLVFIPFTIVGMIFAWGYVYSGSLLASMIAHLLFNSISFALAVSGAAS